jgi:hypothetical protein
MATVAIVLSMLAAILGFLVYLRTVAWRPVGRFAVVFVSFLTVAICGIERYAVIGVVISSLVALSFIIILCFTRGSGGSVR